MAGLSRQDRVLVDDAIRKIYKLGDLDEFAVTAMRELPRLVKSDVTSFNEVNISARRLVSVLDDQSCEKIYLKRRLEIDRFMMQNPLIAHTARTNDGPIKISDFLPDNLWRDTKIYHSVYNRMGVDYQMSISMNLGGNHIVAIALNRRDRDFTERDRRMLAAVQPHVIRAYKNAVRFTETLNRLKGREQMLDKLGADWIDLDSEMRIIRSSNTALNGVTSFFRLQNLDAQRLPPEVETWVRQNGEHALAGERVEPFVKVQGRDRLTLRLIPNDRFGRNSVLVERYIDADSPEPLREMGVTKRQSEVLYWVAQGKTNAEIAIILKISLRTVENHMRSILECLGVENRTEAALAAAAKLKSS